MRTDPSTDRALIAPRLKDFARRARENNCYGLAPVAFPGDGGMRMFSSSAAKPAKKLGGCDLNHFIVSMNTLRALLGEHQKVRERTILIWTGRGWMVGGLYPGEYATAIAALNTDLREGQVTLDAISWGEFNRPPNFHKGIMSVTAVAPQTADQAAAAGLWLQVLAQQNGGQIFAKVKSFADAMAACLEDAKENICAEFRLASNGCGKRVSFCRCEGRPTWREYSHSHQLLCGTLVEALPVVRRLLLPGAAAGLAAKVVAAAGVADEVATRDD